VLKHKIVVTSKRVYEALLGGRHLQKTAQPLGAVKLVVDAVRACLPWKATCARTLAAAVVTVKLAPQANGGKGQGVQRRTNENGHE
jgi:hypothetical protein